MSGGGGEGEGEGGGEGEELGAKEVVPPLVGCLVRLLVTVGRGRLEWCA